MRVLDLARFMAVFSTGLVAGILFGDRMGASFARIELSPSSFVTFQQAQHIHLARLMPVLLGIAVLSSVAWLILGRSSIGTAAILLVALGTVAFITVVILTRTVNVPINNLLMTWQSSSPPPDLREIWARWEHVHSIRTILAVAGFACELLGFGISRKVGAV